MRAFIEKISITAYLISFTVGLAVFVAFILAIFAVDGPASRVATADDSLRSALPLGAAAAFILFGLVRRARRNGKIARMAKSSGLVLTIPSPGLSRGRERAKKIREDRGFGREIMIIGSTGYRSFAAPEGDLRDVLQNCREAKIMLLDPRGQGALALAGSSRDPEITPEAICEQVAASIQSIKKLRSFPTAIRLKLYPDMPLFKLAILGEYASIRHYHATLDARSMPEFVFRNVRRHGGLYLLMCRYFHLRWQDPDIPEYDLDRDELVHHDRFGHEVLRELFPGATREDGEKRGNTDADPLQPRSLIR